MSRVAVKRCGQPGSGDTPLGRLCRSEWVGRGGVEPPTFRFSGGRSYQLSYLPSKSPSRSR
jgi:hypothetical protein